MSINMSRVHKPIFAAQVGKSVDREGTLLVERIPTNEGFPTPCQRIVCVQMTNFALIYRE
jgi:hypothetical protein